MVVILEIIFLEFLVKSILLTPFSVILPISFKEIKHTFGSNPTPKQERGKEVRGKLKRKIKKKKIYISLQI